VALPPMVRSTRSGCATARPKNARVCQVLLANLQSRGLRTDRNLRVILDGSKALRKVFGEAALVQRRQAHETRNILDYLHGLSPPAGSC